MDSMFLSNHLYSKYLYCIIIWQHLLMHLQMWYTQILSLLTHQVRPLLGTFIPCQSHMYTLTITHAHPPPPQVLAIVRHSDLLESAGGSSATPELDEKIRLRGPYVAPLNVLQVRGVARV